MSARGPARRGTRRDAFFSHAPLSIEFQNRAVTLLSACVAAPLPVVLHHCARHAAQHDRGRVPPAGSEGRGDCCRRCARHRDCHVRQAACGGCPGVSFAQRCAAQAAARGAQRSYGGAARPAARPCQTFCSVRRQSAVHTELTRSARTDAQSRPASGHSARPYDASAEGAPPRRWPAALCHKLAPTRRHRRRDALCHSVRGSRTPTRQVPREHVVRERIAATGALLELLAGGEVVKAAPGVVALPASFKPLEGVSATAKRDAAFTVIAVCTQRLGLPGITAVLEKRLG